MHQPLSQKFQGSGQASRGAVLVELAMSVFLFFLLLSGIIDFGTIMRERAVLTEAAHAGSIAVVHYPPYDLRVASSIPESTPDARVEAYRTARTIEGLNAAIQYVAREGLNFKNYYYYSYIGWWDTGVLDARNPGTETTRNNKLIAMVSVTIKPLDQRGSSRRYIITPSFLVDSCAVSRAMVSGEFSTANAFFPSSAGEPTGCR